MHAEFWWRKLKDRDHLEDPGIDDRDNIKRAVKEIHGNWIIKHQIVLNARNFLTS